MSSVSCADPRIPPEHILGLNFGGELFDSGILIKNAQFNEMQKRQLFVMVEAELLMLFALSWTWMRLVLWGQWS
jgi:hypothetical protein